MDIIVERKLMNILIQMINSFKKKDKNYMNLTENDFIYW